MGGDTVNPTAACLEPASCAPPPAPPHPLPKHTESPRLWAQLIYPKGMRRGNALAIRTSLCGPMGVDPSKEGQCAGRLAPPPLHSACHTQKDTTRAEISNGPPPEF